MDKLAIKEAFRKSKIQNRRETGKRYLTKGQLHTIFDSIKSINLPQATNERGFGVQKIGDILGSMGLK